MNRKIIVLVIQNEDNIRNIGVRCIYIKKIATLSSHYRKLFCIKIENTISPASRFDNKIRCTVNYARRYCKLSIYLKFSLFPLKLVLIYGPVSLLYMHFNGAFVSSFIDTNQLHIYIYTIFI